MHEATPLLQRLHLFRLDRIHLTPQHARFDRLEGLGHQLSVPHSGGLTPRLFLRVVELQRFDGILLQAARVIVNRHVTSSLHALADLSYPLPLAEAPPQLERPLPLSAESTPVSLAVSLGHPEAE